MHVWSGLLCAPATGTAVNMCDRRLVHLCLAGTCNVQVIHGSVLVYVLAFETGT